MKTPRTLTYTTLCIYVICLICMITSGCTKKPNERTITTNEEKMSYALGRQVGETIQRQDLPIDREIFAFGLEDAMKLKESRISQEELQSALMKAQETALKNQTASLEAMEKARAAGEKFLAANKKKTGVYTTSSGLQYEILKQGKGAQPTDLDIVEVNFNLNAIDGQKIDSTAERGPQKFSVKNVTAGWSEALKLMNVGSKWRIVMPANLGYGKAGSPPDIPPESVLVYELELLGVEASPKAPEKSTTKN